MLVWRDCFKTETHDCRWYVLLFKKLFFRMDTVIRCNKSLSSVLYCRELFRTPFPSMTKSKSICTSLVALPVQVTLQHVSSMVCIVLAALLWEKQIKTGELSWCSEIFRNLPVFPNLSVLWVAMLRSKKSAPPKKKTTATHIASVSSIDTMAFKYIQIWQLTTHVWPRPDAATFASCERNPSPEDRQRIPTSLWGKSSGTQYSVHGVLALQGLS